MATTHLIPELSDKPVEWDPAEWPVIAKAEAMSMVDGGRYVQQQCHVRRRIDGTHFVISSIKDGAIITPHKGVMRTPHDKDDLSRMVMEAVADLRSGPILFDFCMQKLHTVE